MKLLLMAGLLFGGGTVAMQDETINEEVTGAFNQVKQMIQKGFQGSMIERVKESGFPYPNEALLAQLTEEQEAVYTSTIDQINAEYDWQNMTDEEIQVALQEIKVELDALRTELGIEVVKEQARQGKHWNEDFVRGGRQSNPTPNGDGTGECPVDDAVESDTV
jgi:hypothetical protein